MGPRDGVWTGVALASQQGMTTMYGTQFKIVPINMGSHRLGLMQQLYMLSCHALSPALRMDITLSRTIILRLKAPA